MPLHLKVAAPCSASWERMKGDQHVRFCADCKLNVFNLSALTEREAQQLILEKEGRLCVRFYQRTDGTVLTKDCPVGLAARARRAALQIFSMIVTFFIGAMSGLELRPNGWLERSLARWTSAGSIRGDVSGGLMPIAGEPMYVAPLPPTPVPPPMVEPIEFLGKISPEMGRIRMGDVAMPRPQKIRAPRR